MRKLQFQALMIGAALAVSGVACKKEEPKAEAPKAEAAGEAKKEEAKKEEPKNEEPKKEEAKAPEAAPAAAAGMTPEQIADLKAKASSDKIDDKLAGLRIAVSALKTAALDEKALAFKPDQPAVAAATDALNLIASLATNPTLPDPDKAKFKAEFVPVLAEAARLGAAPVRTIIASGAACTALAGDPASLEAIDKVLGESAVNQGWNDLFDCVMTRGPMEYARAVEKKTDYDRWSTIDRQIAVFSAQKNPAAHGYLLGNWMGFKGKNPKIGAGIVAVYATLDNNTKGLAHTVLTNQCDKESGAKVIEELKKAPEGSPEQSWAKALDTGLKACK